MGNCVGIKVPAANQPVDTARPSTGKPCEDIGFSFPPVPKDQSLPIVNKNGVLQACQGGFGDVYRGWIDSYTMTATKPGMGLAVAVKKLRKKGVQGHKEWLTELTFLSQFNHPNVVKLIGYCSESDDRILVYEYMARGSLEAYLRRDSESGLSWSKRIKVAVGVARGLVYLHTAKASVIHRDLKASNILLDSEFNAKLSDFGLAKYGPQGDKSHISTRVLGTRGYFAPEYVATGHLTLRTDVYSFGVVLLEILSGCGAIKKHADGVAADLAVWAKPYLSNKVQLYRVIDKKLQRNFCIEEVYEFADIILKCLNTNAKNRPTMTEVVAALEQLEQQMKKLQCKFIQNPPTRTPFHKQLPVKQEE